MELRAAMEIVKLPFAVLSAISGTIDAISGTIDAISGTIDVISGAIDAIFGAIGRRRDESLSFVLFAVFRIAPVASTSGVEIVVVAGAPESPEIRLRSTGQFGRETRMEEEERR